MAKKKRVKYNWLYMIEDIGWSDLFIEYKMNSDIVRHAEKKKELSSKRLARAFMLHNMKVLGFNLLIPCYVVGQEQPYSEYIDSLRK